MPRLFKALHARQSKSIAGCGDVTMTQMAILNLLRNVPKYKMTELARLLNVTTSAATGMVDRMVRSGFLKRSREAKDRRIINIRITNKGEKAINAIFNEKQRIMVKIFRHFDPKEREAYLNSVKKIYTILTKGQK